MPISGTASARPDGKRDKRTGRASSSWPSSATRTAQPSSRSCRSPTALRLIRPRRSRSRCRSSVISVSTTTVHGSSSPKAMNSCGRAMICASSRTATATITDFCRRDSSIKCSKPSSPATRPASAASRRANDRVTGAEGCVSRARPHVICARPGRTADGDRVEWR